MQYSNHLEKMDLPENFPAEKELVFHEFLAKKAGLTNFRIVPIANDCSARVYYRVFTAEGSKILMDSVAEMKSYHAFMEMGDWLRSKELKAPKIFAHEPEHGLMLIEDFGKHSLHSYLSQTPEQEIALYEKSIDLLVKLHNTTPLMELEAHNYDVLTSGLKRVFVNSYLPTIIPANKLSKAYGELQAIFDDLLRMLPLMKQVVVLRDYHAENLMVLDGLELGIIDFQDAMLGCSAYDLLSLLEDARRQVSPELADHCMKYYYAQAEVQNHLEFQEAYAILSAQRNLRIIGLFHKLGCLEKKEKYAAFIPRVVGYLNKTLTHPRLIDLAEWVQKYNVLDNDELKRK